MKVIKIEVEDLRPLLLLIECVISSLIVLVLEQEKQYGIESRVSSTLKLVNKLLSKLNDQL